MNNTINEVYINRIKAGTRAMKTMEREEEGLLKHLQNVKKSESHNENITGYYKPLVGMSWVEWIQAGQIDTRLKAVRKQLKKLEYRKLKAYESSATR